MNPRVILSAASLILHAHCNSTCFSEGSGEVGSVIPHVYFKASSTEKAVC